jgi:hypothetical protein
MAGALPRLLIRHLPFFYGWIILACACCAGLSRQGGAVATLSIFVEPMTGDFGGSRTALSGAVSPAVCCPDYRHHCSDASWSAAAHASCCASLFC